jgi:hypothetical protein
MEESRPFLRESSVELKRDSRFRWLKLGGRSGIISLWLKNPVSSHSAVFIATSMVWGCIIIMIIYFSPRTFESVAKSTSLQPHKHNTGILATETKYLTCGDSLQEAKARGCEYDILSNHWIPSECADEFSIKEYQSDGSWFPFADVNRTVPLTREELGDRRSYYTSMRDHIVHCAVFWRRQYRALSEGWKYLDSMIVDPEHTMHCSQFLMDMSEYGPDFRTMPIRVFVGHAGCHVRDV